ncbi:hypothetical protein ACR2Y1_003668 [Morganella morganii]
MATHDRKACSAYLTLVASPISNTIAASINKDDKAIVETLRCSHFYMICGRPKAYFSKVTPLKNGFILIQIALDSGTLSSGFIHIPKMSFFQNTPNEFDIKLKCKNNVLCIYLGDDIVFAATPDDLLVMRGRKESVVVGFNNYLEMMTFDLLYVGIAKNNQDSYSRLFERGHKARMDILAAETQRIPGARVSDETYLLLFRIEPITITTFSDSSDFDNDDINFSIDYHRIVADAEKAVISTFKPKYNKQLYSKYPSGIDGLYKQGYNGYSYAIAEGMAFNTAYGTIKGARDSKDILVSNDADFIFVEGDEVTLNISGVDFNIKSDI